jgi:Electron transfer DM13
MNRAAGSVLVLLSTALIAACSAGTVSSIAPPPASTEPSVATTAAPSAASSTASSAVASGPTAVAMGSFHRVASDASGTVSLEHLADGSFAVVFEDFKIAAKEHINVILVQDADVTEGSTIDQTKIVDLGPLTGTEGMQDYKVPTELTAGAMGYHTVVLWDTAMKHVIAAAPLAVK